MRRAAQRRCNRGAGRRANSKAGPRADGRKQIPRPGTGPGRPKAIPRPATGVAGPNEADPRHGHGPAGHRSQSKAGPNGAPGAAKAIREARHGRRRPKQSKKTCLVLSPVGRPLPHFELSFLGPNPLFSSRRLDGGAGAAGKHARPSTAPRGRSWAITLLDRPSTHGGRCSTGPEPREGAFDRARRSPEPSRYQGVGSGGVMLTALKPLFRSAEEH